MVAPARRYRELRPLAQGGMATLALAERDDGCTVVIKRVRPPFDHDPVYRGLFHDEGVVCASLSCENIVRLLDRGEDELGPFLVFEHVDGTDLGVVLESHFAKERGLELGAFFGIALPLCDALASAHEAEGEDGAPLALVHRDVSPGNVLLSKDGEVKLADFGVASSRLKTEHTVAGEMKGKFAYMAPEQSRGAGVDARADVFAAGAVLWECLAGRRLFDGPTDADVVHAVRASEYAPLASLRPEIPPALDEVLRRMLAKDPAARFSSMREALASLREEAALLGLDRGQRAHVVRLARAHPRQELSEHPHVSDLRRRTQRVLQAPSSSAPDLPARRRSLLLAALSAASALVVALFLLRPMDATADEPVRESEPAVPIATAALPASEVMAAPLPEPAAAPDTDAVSEAAPPPSPSPSAPPPKAAPARLAAKPVEKRAVQRRAAKEPALKGFGTLVLESEPWANVSVDGEPLGQHTPLIGLRLPAGRHEVTLENPVYGLARKITVDISPQRETRRFVDLTKR